MQRDISLLGSKSPKRIYRSLGARLALVPALRKETKRGNRVFRVGARHLDKGKLKLSKTRLLNLEQIINEHSILHSKFNTELKF